MMWTMPCRGLAVVDDVRGLVGGQVPVDRRDVHPGSQGAPRDLEVLDPVLDEHGHVATGAEPVAAQEVGDPAGALLELAVGELGAAPERDCEVVRVPVEPFLGEADYRLRPLTLQQPCERLRGFVLIDAVQLAVGIVEALRSGDAEGARCRLQLGLANLTEPGSTARPALAARHRHDRHAVPGFGTGREGAADEQRLVVRVREHGQYAPGHQRARARRR